MLPNMPQIAEREYQVVHLGTLSEERLEFLCAVLAALRQRQPAIRALIVGVREDQVKQLQARLPAEEHDRDWQDCLPEGGGATR